jgi:hypothetical protein
MALSQDEIEAILEECVFGFLVERLKLADTIDAIDGARTFGDAPQAGYGVVAGDYGALCKAAQACIARQCGSALVLAKDWCEAHFYKPIDDFDAGAAKLVAAAPHA